MEQTVISVGILVLCASFSAFLVDLVIFVSGGENSVRCGNISVMCGNMCGLLDFPTHIKS